MAFLHSGNSKDKWHSLIEGAREKIIWCVKSYSVVEELRRGDVYSRSIMLLTEVETTALNKEEQRVRKGDTIQSPSMTLRFTVQEFIHRAFNHQKYKWHSTIWASGIRH